MDQNSAKTLSFVAIALLLTVQMTLASYGVRLLRDTATTTQMQILSVARAAGR